MRLRVAPRRVRLYCDITKKRRQLELERDLGDSDNEELTKLISLLRSDAEIVRRSPRLRPIAFNPMELTHLALPQPAIVLEMGGLRLYPKDWEQISVHRTIADIKERLRDKAAIVRPDRHGPDVRPVPTDQRCRVQAELLDMVTIAEHMAVADAALFVLMVAASADGKEGPKKLAARVMKHVEKKKIAGDIMCAVAHSAACGTPAGAAPADRLRGVAGAAGGC